MAPPRLRIVGRTFRDGHDREITLHGINVSGECKYPLKPDQPSHVKDAFFDGDNVSFVGRPFPVDEAHVHFARLKQWGYNTIRYIFTWEALEHAGPGKYDEGFIEYTIQVLRLAKSYGFYVFMDPHQDVWSRFTGGSGAPMWTIYACGLDPTAFRATQAALVQNTWPDPTSFPRMIWATNQERLACQTIITLFFAGKDYAPKAIIDGVNIQDYLQSHFINAVAHLARRVKEAGDIEDDVVIGWENINEPFGGLIGFEDLTQLPADQNLKQGPAPTAWQAILTGSGRVADVDTYEFGRFGPRKSGSELVDPQGRMAWLPADYDESRYGWRRDPGWKLGECLWAQHGVWDPSGDVLLVKDYFTRHPTTGEAIVKEDFPNHYFLQHYRDYSAAIRKVFPNTIMFCQCTPLAIPPRIRGTDLDDPNMVFASHFYDGLTLINKKWNRFWNVDVVGVMRKKYSTPALAVRLGESAIRNVLRDQLSYLREEGVEYAGEHPCVFTEIGIPFDMDERYAYKTGDYTSQVHAMDANHFALEGSGSAGFTLWTYTHSNSHFWGDNWNGEDLSIYSPEDVQLPVGDADDRAVSPNNLKNTISVGQMSTSTSPSIEAQGVGMRAAEAWVRPTPVVTHCTSMTYGFDLRTCVFTLSLMALSSTAEEAPTEIFLPSFHFPRGAFRVEVSGGKWEYSVEGEGVPVPKIKWWHAEGEQKMTITGVKRKEGKPMDGEESSSYWEICRQMAGCAVM